MGLDEIFYAVETCWSDELHTHFLLSGQVSTRGRETNLGAYLKKKKKKSNTGFHFKKNYWPFPFKHGMMIQTIKL